ncbi:hypothetical protein [Brevibacterium album]|uniref:hypothetical protein n=1 Tax=Brevibacterium album TaxID=417948 RepID=UPI0003FC1002|nr:hypothetical protein [Brevibacterium album]
MTATTIKVPRELRDRLKEQAAAESRTLGQHLAHLAGLADRERRFAELERATAATSAEDMASYRAETAWWDRAAGG